MSFKFIQSLFAQSKPNPAENPSTKGALATPGHLEKRAAAVPTEKSGPYQARPAEAFNVQKDDVDKINIATGDFYRKIDPASCKSLALGCLNAVVKDPETIRKKICKRRFMFGKNLEHPRKKEKPQKAASLKQTGKKQDLSEFKNLKYDFAQLKGINDAWNKYILDIILSENKKEEALQKVLKADFHGSHLTVLDSKCASLVAKAGIVIKETKNTFIICPASNKPITVLKRASVFEIKIKEKRYKIYGPALENRLEERFKAKLHFNHMFKMNEGLIKLI